MGIKTSKRCRHCQEMKEFTEFYNSHNGKYGLTSWCKQCSKDANTRDSKYMSRYGITVEDYNKLLADQGWCCAICKISWLDDESVKHWPVDHSHITGKVRGIICDLCNRGLGYFKEDAEILRSAATYLEGD
jgi:hypothetical protein